MVRGALVHSQLWARGAYSRSVWDCMFVKRCVQVAMLFVYPLGVGTICFATGFAHPLCQMSLFSMPTPFLVYSKAHNSKTHDIFLRSICVHIYDIHIAEGLFPLSIKLHGLRHCSRGRTSSRKILMSGLQVLNPSHNGQNKRNAKLYEFTQGAICWANFD